MFYCPKINSSYSIDGTKVFPLIRDINLENFQQTILEDSKEKFVLVAFWAEQVPESIELRDKLAVKTQHAGQHVIMAGVDCQTHQQIAMQFGIQGLPTAVLVKDAQPVDALSGPQNDETIDAFLAKHLPQEQDELLFQAKEALATNNVNEAFSFASKAHQIDEERADIKFVLIDTYIQLGKLVEAEQLLASIKMVDQDGDYAALVSKLELASQAAESPEIKALEEDLAKNPDNIETAQKLATQYHQANRHEDALELLLGLLRKDPTNGETKQVFVDILKALPEGDPVAGKYRRKLYAFMY